MSFYIKQNSESINSYKKYLRFVGNLSQLFSESKTPYLYYRVAEKVFCKTFFADDLSRSDISIDARKSKIGIGLKTFLKNNSRTFQKVAEFNRDKPLYDLKSTRDRIIKISELRNKRIELVENAFLVDKLLYHCIVRSENKFSIFEEPLQKINIENIKEIKDKENSIYFNDGLNEYSFLKSKSTLTKRFITSSFVDEIEIEIFNDPFEALELLGSRNLDILQKEKYETVYLPLYGSNKKVHEKSGLNQWNAAGRKRDISEVYIPIPAIIHKLFPGFFPDRNQSFILILPNKKKLKTKICQQNNKALMSHPNKELGQWILRDILKLKEGELATYDKLQTIGIDSVRIDKASDLEYEMNFSEIDSYENFIGEKLD